MIEALGTAVVAVILFWSIYAAASRAMQLFSLADRVGNRNGTEDRGALDALTKDPREVLLAAELFKSLAFLLIIVLVLWESPRVASRFYLPEFPLTVVALGIVWFLRGLAGEVLPKAAPLEERDDAPLPRFAGLALIWHLFRPLLAVTERFSRRHAAIDRGAEREDIVEHAIDALAEAAGMDEPVIEPDERKMIQGVIRLEDTEVREVMVPRVDIVAVEAHATVEDVRRIAAKTGHSRLPVYDEDIDSILGVLYVKDLFCGGMSSETTDLASVARRAFMVPETKKVDGLLEEFKRQKKHIAIVVDEFGGTAGLITLEDILEEIVGEIEDEHDQRTAVEWLGDGVMRAEGVVPLEEIAEAFEIELPGDEFETIGGLIYDKVGGVPTAGQSFEAFGLNFTIEKMDGQRIRLVRVEKQR